MWFQKGALRTLAALELLSSLTVMVDTACTDDELYRTVRVHTNTRAHTHARQQNWEIMNKIDGLYHCHCINVNSWL